MKLGLKLWSINTEDYLFEAVRLFEMGIYDYIELYVVPDALENLKKWEIAKKNHNIPFIIHAPHFMHKVNLADKNKKNFNIKVFKQVEEFVNELNAQYVVVHSGMDGDIEETINQLKKINLQNVLIENKPYKAPLIENTKCRGAVFEEVEKVINEVGCGFCLDVGHAICAANSLEVEPYGYVKQFNKLNPTCYHLSDNLIDSEIDSHLNFGRGNYDFKKIFDIIDSNKYISIETKKSSKSNLDDFVEDVKWLKTL